MIKHHLTKYIVDGKRFVTSWVQFNIFGKCFCLSKKTIEVE